TRGGGRRPEPVDVALSRDAALAAQAGGGREGRVADRRERVPGALSARAPRAAAVRPRRALAAARIVRVRPVGLPPPGRRPRLARRARTRVGPRAGRRPGSGLGAELPRGGRRA